jgi:hypothetical protein
MVEEDAGSVSPGQLVAAGVNAPSAAPKGSAVEVALASLDRAVMATTVADDPLRHAFTGLGDFLRAQQELEAEFSATMTSAWPPIPLPELRRSIRAGIADQAGKVVKAINLAGVAAICGGMVVMLVIGVAGGYWLGTSASGGITAVTDCVPAPQPRGQAFTCTFWTNPPTGR